MEPVWKLSTSVPLNTEFDLTETFTLASDAGAFVFSDLLGMPDHYLGRQSIVSGKYEPIKRLTGKYEPIKRLEGDA
jgi:urocanate hydratase